ncbi:MAG: LysR family transcriptional regulator [Betaproteobacteria bacterium]|nr:LysR family transcriptional regulator [Betaproteobacteria bacterium]
MIVPPVEQRPEPVDADAADLLLFANVMDAGSFSRAAERLKLPKSTLSRRVSALEARLGEKLLQRTTRRLVLTDFGEGVLAHARAIGSEVDAARALAQSRQQLPAGRLRVSMPADFAARALSAMLATFVTDHPGVSLDIDVSPRRVDLVAENFDLAIRMGDLPPDSQLTARRVAVFHTGLYAAPRYLAVHGSPAEPDELSGRHALMLLSRSGDPVPWTLLRGGDPPDAWQGELPLRTSANSPDLLLKLACAGAGIAAVGTFFAEPYVNAGELVRVLPGWWAAPSTAWAVFPGRKLLATKTRAFIEALAKALEPCNPPESVDDPHLPATAGTDRGGLAPQKSGGRSRTGTNRTGRTD